MYYDEFAIQEKRSRESAGILYGQAHVHHRAVELDRAIDQGEDIVVVDVRAEEDYQKGHIPGAINLPRERWNTCEGLSRDHLNVLYCYTHVCHLAATAAAQFAEKGFPVMELEGGFEAWRENDLRIETEAELKSAALVV